jgi:hypothetical protein
MFQTTAAVVGNHNRYILPLTIMQLGLYFRRHLNYVHLSCAIRRTAKEAEISYFL